jgi:uncharacterized membrane protein YoaK (UPF0700 family)
VLDLTARGRQVWRHLAAHPDHGVLPLLLLLLTVVTGVVDAVSILSLGRVFVANMTGNVVFIGFAIAGAPGFSLAASLAALAGFVLGAAAGGALSTRLSPRRRLFAVATAVEVVLLSAGFAILAGLHHRGGSGAADLVAAILAVALGLQNAVVRRLAVLDLTTTVLTMTLTGIAADLRAPGGLITLTRRLLAVLTMLAGAAIGTLLDRHAGAQWALLLAVVLTAAVAAAALTADHRGNPPT